MAKTSLGKKDLQKEKQQLKLYLKLLPSLDLKRTQLLAEHARANKVQQQLKKEIEQVMAQSAENLPMLANQDVKLDKLVRVSSIFLEEQSIVGIKVPFVQKIEFEEMAYALLATPYWIDSYIELLKKAVELSIHMQVMQSRIEILIQAMRRVTQHVNLFEKILIPNAKKNIQRIQIILGEAQRNAVVRSKLAKALHKKSDQIDLFEEPPL